MREKMTHQMSLQQWMGINNAKEYAKEYAKES
jgi:hypothetical protein